MRPIETFFRSVSNVFGAVALIFLMFLMLGTTVDAAARGLWGRPISGVFELAELSMVMVVFLGLGWTMLDNAHIRVTLLVERMPAGLARVAETLSWLFAALFLMILAMPASQDAVHSFAIREFRWGHIEFPIWWAKIALAIGLWFGCLQLAFHAVYVALRGAPRHTPERDLRIEP